MPCGYYNEAKDNNWDGIYCNRIGGRPGNRYWSCYCNAQCSDCPHLGGSDPYALHPDTRERNRVIEQISSLPYRVTVNDRGKIQDARRAYERLSDRQKRFVNNASRLDEAERAYKHAVEAEEERERNAYAAQEEARRRQEAEEKRKREEQRKQRDSRGTGQSRNEDRETTFPMKTGSAGTQGTDKFLYWLESVTDPRQKNTSWLIRVYRFILPAFAWILVLAYRPASVPLPTSLFVIFATLQLFSFAVAYIAPRQMKLRLVLWGIELLLLLITGGLLYHNPDPDILMEIGIAALAYPAMILGYYLVKIVYTMITA